ncbi:MAG: DUF134 domain-containing protein [Candidatus Saccharicenans sp.]
MPRPFCRRRIGWRPGQSRFFPEGFDPTRVDLIGLTLDEFEAIRLADLEGLYQEEGARKMGISRPTFARILESGRKKVAEALVHGRGLVIEGGPVEFQAKDSEQPEETDGQVFTEGRRPGPGTRFGSGRLPGRGPGWGPGHGTGCGPGRRGKGRCQKGE